MQNSKIPFAAEKDSKQFFNEVMILLIREMDSRRKKYVPTENFQVFHHGTGWSFQRQEKEGFKPHSGELKKVSTGCAVKMDRILSNDVNAVSDFILETAIGMELQMVGSMKAEMKAVSIETGNVTVVSKGGSLAEAYLKMIKTTQASIDRDGNVSPPVLIPEDPAFIEKLQLEIIERGVDFQKQIEEAIKEQNQNAATQEAARLAQYDAEE